MRGASRTPSPTPSARRLLPLQINYSAKPKVSLKPFQRLAGRGQSPAGFWGRAPTGSKGRALGRRLWRRDIRYYLKATLRKQSSELFANATTAVWVRDVEDAPTICRHSIVRDAGERNSPLQSFSPEQIQKGAGAHCAPLHLLFSFNKFDAQNLCVPTRFMPRAFLPRCRRRLSPRRQSALHRRKRACRSRSEPSRRP